MAKKGQMTLFMIIGIVTLFIFAFLFYVIASDTKVIDKIYPEKNQPISSFVQSCLEHSAKESLKELLAKGGKSESLAYDILPSSADMEKTLAVIISAKVEACVDGFTVFQDQGYSITSVKPKSDVSVNPNDVLFLMDYKVSAKKGDSETLVEEFRYSVEDIKIPYLIELADSIIADDEWINANELIEELETNKLSIRMMAGQGKILYSIESGYYRFNFGQTI